MPSNPKITARSNVAFPYALRRRMKRNNGRTGYVINA